MKKQKITEMAILEKKNNLEIKQFDLTLKNNVILNDKDILKTLEEISFIDLKQFQKAKPQVRTKENKSTYS